MEIFLKLRGNIKFKVVLGVGAVVAIGAIAIKIMKTFKAGMHSEHQIKRIIDTISELKNPSVRIRNPIRVEEILCQFIRDGKLKLTVAADFDYTMGRFHENGNKCHSCHGALNTSFLLPKTVQDQSRQLFERYHPIEIDQNITSKEKTIFMKEWWKKAEALIVNTHLNKLDIKRVIKESKVRLRSGCEVMLDSLQQNEVPLIIISAGLGDLIVEAINQQSELYDNIKIVANFMDFDTNGTIVAFKNETIHCCNKNEAPIYHSECFSHISNRSNAILIGDMVEDSYMLDAVSHLQTVLKIGYLNDKCEEFLPKFMERYDIVLVDDQTFDVVNGILQKLL